MCYYPAMPRYVDDPEYTVHHLKHSAKAFAQVVKWCRMGVSKTQSTDPLTDCAWRLKRQTDGIAIMAKHAKAAARKVLREARRRG